MKQNHQSQAGQQQLAQLEDELGLCRAVSQVPED
jgi:hypothetical protein